MGGQGIDAAAFAERLRRARARQLLTQDELAAKSSVGKVSLSRLENGHTTPRFSTIKRLATGLDVSPHWLAYGEDEPGR